MPGAKYNTELPREAALRREGNYNWGQGSGGVKDEEETGVYERRKKSCVKKSRRSRRTLTEQKVATAVSAETKAV